MTFFLLNSTDMMMQRPQLDIYTMGSGVTAFSTTRQGGYSEGNYGEFNINAYCGDQPQHIRSNRKLLCKLLGISDDRLLMPHQIHQNKILRVDEQLLRHSEEQRRQLLDGYDALMTNVPGICIGVSTADCIPLLLYDSEHQAVCAIHAGWRGTVARIAEHAVGAMTAAYGTRPSQLKAQIGPGISLQSFEVGDEVYEAFSDAGFDMRSISRQEEKWHINLPECNRQQLVAAGIPTQAIQVAAICTYQHPDRYFSARRLGIHSGRIFTGICLNAPV